jgi:hypothetical protein
VQDLLFTLHGCFENFNLTLSDDVKPIGTVTLHEYGLAPLVVPIDDNGTDVVELRLRQSLEEWRDR